MHTLLILGCVSMVCLSYFKEKKAYNPVTIIFSVWSITIFLATLRLFNIYEASDKTYYIIAMGLGAFLIGYYIIGWNGKMVYDKTKNNVINNEFTLNVKIIYILMIVAFIILSKTAINSINLILQGNALDYIRYSARDEVMASSSIVYVYIAQPIVNLMISISALNFYSNKKNKIIFGGTALLTLLTVISEGGRFLLLYYIINYVYAAIIFNKKLKISKKQKNRMVLISLMMIVAIIYITMSRGSKLGETFYKYIVGCIPHLSNKIEYLDSMSKYTWGISSYQGFIRPVFAFLRKIGMISNLPVLVSLAETITLMVESPIMISNESQFNGFITMFYYFYADLGIAGVIIGSTIYGYLCKKVYYNLNKRFTNFNIIVYLLFIQTMYLSIVRYQFTNYMFALSFLYLLVVKNNKKYN